MRYIYLKVFLYCVRLKDACVLLTLPANSSKIETETDDKKSQQKTLSQVISVLSDDEMEPTEMSRILENLGVYHLTPNEAKDVVERRIDCWQSTFYIITFVIIHERVLSYQFIVFSLIKRPSLNPR